jgi:asparagine synthase (glutamine-hydrolysing)
MGGSPASAESGQLTFTSSQPGRLSVGPLRIFGGWKSLPGSARRSSLQKPDRAERCCAVGAIEQRGGAIAGVFGARAGVSYRCRLSEALRLDGQPQVRASQHLAYGCAGGADLADLEEANLTCLLEGTVYNAAEVSRRLSLPSRLAPAALLARGYAQLGSDLWSLLRGDYVALVWDRAAEAGVLVRDQLGGRALFLHRSGGALAFASELRNLVAMLPRRPDPDEVAVAHWLLPSVLPGRRTLYSKVEEMPPATYLSLGPEGARAVNYWRPRYRQRPLLTPGEANRLVDSSLQLAVRRRSVAAGPSAILLSGGIDSATVAGVSAACLSSVERPRRAYSAVFPAHPEIDESGLIAKIASHSRLQATAIEIEPGGLLGAAVQYIEAWQALPPTPNISFLRPLLDRAAADGVRVLQDGEGGDAVFWHSAPLLAERLRRGRLFSAWSLAGRFPEYGRPTSWRTRLAHLRQWGRTRDFSPSPQEWLAVDPGLLEAEDEDLGAEGPAWWIAQVAGILGPGSRMAHDVTRRNGALSGIEARHPLLDLDLIEEALSLPPELAFAREFNRPVLRGAVAGRVPDEARLRPYKSNFDPVIVAGMDVELPLVEALLLRQGAHIGAYTDRNALIAHLASPPAPLGRRRAWAMTLWNLATLECWLRLQAGEKALPTNVLGKIRPLRYSFSTL